MKELILADLLAFRQRGATLLDIRDPNEFASGFITGSIFFAPDRDIEKDLKGLFDADTSFLVLIAQDTQNAFKVEKWIFEKSGIQTTGYYQWNRKDFDPGRSPLNMIIQVEADEFLMDMRFDDKILPIDLRSKKQFEAEHLPGSKSLPLNELSDIAQIASLDESSNIYFYGQSENESLTAASLLKKHGLENVRTVSGGWQSICHEPYFRNLKLALKSKRRIK